jgi:hypothetical protein
MPKKNVINTKIANLLIAAEKHLYSKTYHRALKAANDALELLIKVDEEQYPDFFFDLGICYHYLLISYKEINDIANLKQTSLACIEKFSAIQESELNSFDFKIVRRALRLAYACEAMDYLLKSKFEESAEEIKKCFDLKYASGDNEDPLFDYYELRAKIFQHAAESNPTRWLSVFETHLIELEFKMTYNPALKVTDPALISTMKTENYQYNKRNHPLIIGSTQPDNETWPAAVERYKKFVMILDRFNFSDEVVKPADFLPKPTLAVIGNLEQKYNCKVPVDLGLFYLSHGPLTIHDPSSWGSFRMYDNQNERWPLFSPIIGLIDYTIWGGRPEFEQSFSKDEIELIDSHYFSFGHIFIDDNCYEHLFFSRSGKFGSIEYDQDRWDLAEPLFRKLLTNEFDFCTFDRIISNVITKVIDRHLESLLPQLHFAE